MDVLDNFFLSEKRERCEETMAVNVLITDIYLAVDGRSSSSCDFTGIARRESQNLFDARLGQSTIVCYTTLETSSPTVSLSAYILRYPWTCILIKLWHILGPTSSSARRRLHPFPFVVFVFVFFEAVVYLGKASRYRLSRGFVLIWQRGSWIGIHQKYKKASEKESCGRL